MTQYNIIIHKETYNKADAYLHALKHKTLIAGLYMQQQLTQIDLNSCSTDEFIECLINTKKPQIYAESAILGDGSDWNQAELSILGDIGVAVPVTIYDNGRHHAPKINNTPFSGTLLYIPGALLRNDNGQTPADWKEVTHDNKQMDFPGYYGLYKRRLLPMLLYANTISRNKGKQAFITIPSIGCGQFAGPFRGTLSSYFKRAIKQLLTQYGEQLSHIKAIYYDPYQSETNERFKIHELSFLIRPLMKGNENKSQLCHPESYEENYKATRDQFSECEFFSFVAWDHVSWPGNDFFIGHRATDDGVKSAATDSMEKLTGIQGHYNTSKHRYIPPEHYRNWEQVVLDNEIKIQITDKNKSRLQVFSEE